MHQYIYGFQLQSVNQAGIGQDWIPGQIAYTTPTSLSGYEYVIVHTGWVGLRSWRGQRFKQYLKISAFLYVFVIREKPG